MSVGLLHISNASSRKYIYKSLQQQKNKREKDYFKMILKKSYNSGFKSDKAI